MSGTDSQNVAPKLAVARTFFWNAKGEPIFRTVKILGGYSMFRLWNGRLTASALPRIFMKCLSRRSATSYAAVEETLYRLLESAKGVELLTAIIAALFEFDEEKTNSTSIWISTTIMDSKIIFYHRNKILLQNGHKSKHCFACTYNVHLEWTCEARRNF